MSDQEQTRHPAPDLAELLRAAETADAVAAAFEDAYDAAELAAQDAWDKYRDAFAAQRDLLDNGWMAAAADETGEET